VPTELGHVTEAFTRIALAHPGLHFTLRHNDKTVHEVPACRDAGERIAAFFGADLAESLIAVASEDGPVRLAGYVANPMHSRTNNRLQYLFLNGRSIRDRSLSHALSEAYRGLLLVGRYPICFLNLAMPPELVDVNVHPTKLEVRFQDGGRLYSQLLGMLRMKFLTVDLKARATAGASGDGPALGRGPADPPAELVAWAKEQLSAVGSGPAEEAADSPHPMFPNDPRDAETGPRPDPTRPAGEPLRLFPFARPSPGPPPEGRREALSARRDMAAAPDVPEPLASGRLDAAAGCEVRPLGRPADSWQRPRALQVHNRYLIAETDDGLEVIDQHALHERILYEQLRERVLAGPLESQRLLVPEPVDLTAAEAAAVLQERELLAGLGVAVEPFGGDTVLIESYPAMLANLPPAEVLREVVDHLLEGGKRPERRDVVDRLLHSIACKAAVKYGDSLSPAEVEALLAQRHLAQDHHHCPHGRPTALVFTREDLDRQFQRI
jgi:DNA mismatch repair protein MutL